MKTPTFTIRNNQMYIGEVLATDLVKSYGTPLYVKNQQVIEENIQLFLTHFQHAHQKSEVIYASKAFSTIAMMKLVVTSGIFCDVVSAGELMTALKANVHPSKIYFHGNNKSDEELQLAITHRIGTLVIDNPNEYQRLTRLNASNQVIGVMLRVNPGIDAHTHHYIATSKHDSKFGLSIHDPSTLDFLASLNRDPNIQLLGIHSHIGSQIFEAESYLQEVDILTNFIKLLHQDYHIDIKKLNLGGGFGIKYTQQDSPLLLEDFLETLINYVYECRINKNLPEFTVCIEPGRSIVGEAGITLYTVTTSKTTLNQKHYCFIDGSMADHLRTALYQAEYEAILANRCNDKETRNYTITGKACESGDILIHDCPLPLVQEGDILAVLSTGAYHYSMASNYNRLLKPPVVFVHQGKASLVVRRETYDDLLATEVMQ